MAVEARALYVYSSVTVEATEVDGRGLYSYQNIAIEDNDVPGRSLYTYQDIAFYTTLEGRALYSYASVTTKVSELTPLEVQLLTSGWSIERILNPK